MPSRALWYADGLRWIGTLFTGAAEHLERNAADSTPLDPRIRREIEEYVSNVRTRAHLN